MIIIPDSITVTGAIIASAGFTGPLARTNIPVDSLVVFDMPLEGWRTHDAFERSPSHWGASAGEIAITFDWTPTIADATFFTAEKNYRVTAITARVEVTGTDGGAVTGAIRKAASGGDIAAGTILHTGTINLKGTVDTNQTITLTTTLADLEIASGTSIGFNLTGTATLARGTVTVFLIPAQTDALRLTAGVYGTGLPMLITRDYNAAVAGVVTHYARRKFTLPWNYQAASTVKVRLCAGFVNAAASASGSVNVEAYVAARSNLVSATNPLPAGGNCVTTPAYTTANSTAFAEFDFVLNSASFVPGTVLDIRIAYAASSVTVSSHYGAITHTELLCNVQG